VKHSVVIKTSMNVAITFSY